MFSKLSASASQVTVADDVIFDRRSLSVSGRKTVNFDAVLLQRRIYHRSFASLLPRTWLLPVQSDLLSHLVRRLARCVSHRVPQHQPGRSVLTSQILVSNCKTRWFVAKRRTDGYLGIRCHRDLSSFTKRSRERRTSFEA